MSKGIPLSKLSDEWFKNPEFVREYDALEEEFALATAFILAQSEQPAKDRDHPKTRSP